MKILLFGFYLSLILGCTNELYFKDTNYCNDILFLNKSKKLVTGKVYFLNDQGKKSGYTSYIEGVPNGKFQEWGYDGQDIHSGNNITFNINDVEPKLGEKYLRGFISEMKEGDFYINSLILVKKDTSLDIVDSHKLKVMFEKFISADQRKRNSKIDSIIYRYPKNDECQ